MFIHDKKNALTTIMARRGEKGGERVAGPAPMKPEVSLMEGGEVDGRHMAAQDMMSAMHEKSPQKMADAMANFMDIHMSMKDSGDDEPELE